MCAGHFASIFRLMVIHAVKVKPAVYDVEQELFREVLSKESCLGCSDMWTDEDFTVAEGNNIGWTFVTEERAVNTGHFLRTNKDEADLIKS